MNVSKRRASFAARYLPTSKPFTSPASREGSNEASKREMGAMPDLPARMFDQASDTPMPTGAMIPRPVTTTLRRAKFAPNARASGFSVRFDEVDGLLHGRDLLGFLVRDFSLELFFQRHDEL